MPGQIIRFSFGAPTNAGKPWSDMDDSDLLDFDEQGKPIDETAEFSIEPKLRFWRGWRG
jgi:hypothetical protein